MAGSSRQRTHDLHPMDEAESRLRTLAHGPQVPGPGPAHEASGAEIAAGSSSGRLQTLDHAIKVRILASQPILTIPPLGKSTRKADPR